MARPPAVRFEKSGPDQVGDGLVRQVKAELTA